MTLNQPGSPSELPPELMTVTETAQYLRIPVPTVYYFINKKKLPTVQESQRLKIRKDVLDNCLRVICVAGINKQVQQIFDAKGFKPDSGIFLRPTHKIDNNTDIVVVDSPETDMSALGISDTFSGTIIHIIEGDTIPSGMPTGHFPTTGTDLLQTLNGIAKAIRTPERSQKE